MKEIKFCILLFSLISFSICTTINFDNFLNHITFNQNPYNFCWAYSVSSHMSFSYLHYSESKEYRIFNPLQITLYSIPGIMFKKNADGGQRLINVMEKLKGYKINTIDEGDSIIYDDPKKNNELVEKSIQIDMIKPLFMLNLAISSLETKQKYDIQLLNQNKTSLKIVGSISCNNYTKKYINCENLQNQGYMKLIELGPYIAGMKLNIEKDKINGRKSFYWGENKIEKYLWSSDLCWKDGENDDHLLSHAILVLNVERVTKATIPKEFGFIREGYFKVTILNSWGNSFGKMGKAEIYFKDEKSDCGLLNEIYVPVYDINKEKYEDLIGSKFTYQDKISPYEGFSKVSKDIAFLSDRQVTLEETVDY